MAQRDHTHEYRIRVLERQSDDNKLRLDSVEPELQKLQYWRDGNGGLGAEQRIQRIEREYMSRARTDELIQQASERTVNLAIDKMNRQGRHSLRDWISGLSLIVSVAVLVVMVVAL